MFAQYNNNERSQWKADKPTPPTKWLIYPHEVLYKSTWNHAGSILVAHFVYECMLSYVIVCKWNSEFTTNGIGCECVRSCECDSKQRKNNSNKTAEMLGAHLSIIYFPISLTHSRSRSLLTYLYISVSLLIIIYIRLYLKSSKLLR